MLSLKWNCDQVCIQLQPCQWSNQGSSLNETNKVTLVDANAVNGVFKRKHHPIFAMKNRIKRRGKNKRFRIALFQCKGLCSHGACSSCQCKLYFDRRFKHVGTGLHNKLIFDRKPQAILNYYRGVYTGRIAEKKIAGLSSAQTPQ